MSSAWRRLAPREGLECLSMKMGRTRVLVELGPGPQAGKSGYPRSQDADMHPNKQWFHLLTRGSRAH